jgi:hypothetical protein
MIAEIPDDPPGVGAVSGSENGDAGTMHKTMTDAKIGFQGH